MNGALIHAQIAASRARRRIRRLRIENALLMAVALALLGLIGAVAGMHPGWFPL